MVHACNVAEQRKVPIIVELLYLHLSYCTCPGTMALISKIYYIDVL